MTKRKQRFGTGLAALALVAGTSTLANAREGEVEITGPVAGASGTCPALRFTIGAQRIITNATTDFDEDTCPDIKNGIRVEVEGTVRSDGVLVAREVERK